jgi:hypothetical protein
VIRAQSRDEYARIIREVHSRDLTTATLAELAVLANTLGRYGMGTADSQSLTVFEGGRAPGVIIVPAEIPDQ